MSARMPLRLIALLGLAAGAALAQTFPFQLLLTSGTQQFTAANGTTVGFQAEVGQSVSVHIVATYFPSNSISM